MKQNNLLLIVLFLTSYSFGQKDLTATEAVFIALENNYDILISEKQHNINETNNNTSKKILLPTIELSIAQNNTIQDNTKNPFTFTPGVILSQSIMPSLNSNWNIFTGFSVRMTKQRFEQLEEQTANNTVAIVETTIQEVLKAYFSAQLQKERLALFKNILSLSRDRMKYYEIKEKYSNSNSLELLQFKNQYLTDSTNYLLQEISYENSIRNLKLLMNDGDSTNSIVYNLTDNIEMAIEPIDFSNAQTDMMANNQNLKNQYIGLELQKTNTEMQKATLYPTLSFQAGVQPGWSRIQNLQDQNFKLNTSNLSYYGNFNLRYTLFNNWQNKRAVDISRIQEEISALSIERMEKSMTNALDNLIAMYQARVQLVEISSENTIYAKKAFELAQKRLNVGSINSIDLANFQNNYRNTIMAHYENLYNRLDTYLEIYKMTGKIGLKYTK
ncbi:MAG: TolC family protein [Crocinitomicaceae bacterium]|nr:TolC family protein [Crocinitomicaceae bacterium]